MIDIRVWFFCLVVIEEVYYLSKSTDLRGDFVTQVFFSHLINIRVNRIGLMITWKCRKIRQFWNDYYFYNVTGGLLQNGERFNRKYFPYAKTKVIGGFLNSGLLN